MLRELGGLPPLTFYDFLGDFYGYPGGFYGFLGHFYGFPGFLVGPQVAFMAFVTFTDDLWVPGSSSSS